MASTYGAAVAGVMPGTTGNLDPTSANNPAGSAGLAVGTGTGRFGLVPVFSDISGGVSDAINDFWNWLNAPFTEPMTPGSLTIIVGTIIVAVMFWNLVLYHVRIAAEAI